MINSLNKNYVGILKTHIIYSILLFSSLTFIFVFYLLFISEKNSYVFKYELSYDPKLIDESVYKIYVESKFSKYKFSNGNSFYIECEDLKSCEDKQKNFLESVDEINVSLWSTAKKFLDTKIPEIESKISNSNIDLTNNNIKEYDPVTTVDKAYMMLLNLEYIRNRADPSLIKAKTEIIDNKWNKTFTELFNFTLLNFIFTLTFFVSISLFKPIRKKLSS